MEPLLILLLLICVEGFIILNSSLFKNEKAIFLIIVFLEIVIFTGFRDPTIGSDTETYVSFIEINKGISFKEIWDLSPSYYPYTFEPGYMLICHLCSYFNLSDTQFLFVISLLIYAPFFILIYRESNHPLISVLTFFAFGFFYYSLGIFRQSIAISICTLAIPFLKSRDFIKFSIIILLASTIHQTALCWFLLYVISKINSNHYEDFIIPIAILVIPFGQIAVDILIMMFPKYSSYVGTFRSEGGGSYFMLLLLLITFILLRLSKEQNDANYNVIMASTSLAIILQSISYSFGLVGRGVMYFSIFEIVLLPYVLDKAFEYKTKYIVNYLFILGLCMLTVLTQFRGNKFIVPYKFKSKDTKISENIYFDYANISSINGEIISYIL